MRDIKILPILVGLFVAAGLSSVANGLIVVGGAGAIHDRGWLDGSVAMANLPTRFSWWEGPPFGGGQYVFQYRCRNTAAFNEALKVFAAIKADRLELVVHNGPKQGHFGGDGNRLDWTFTAWVPENWNRMYNNEKSLFMSDHPDFRQPVPALRVDVYVGGGAIEWDKVQVPENITVIDKRPRTISKRFAGKGLVLGRVLDLDTGKPVAGAQVIVAERTQDVNPERPITVLADEQGHCQIGRIALGNYTISVRAKGYAAKTIGHYSNKLPEIYEFETKLARPGRISGVVVDSEGKPIKGARVYVSDMVATDGSGYSCPDLEEAITGDEGEFDIGLLARGSANLRCRLDGMYLSNSIFDVYAVPSKGIKLVMTKTSIVRGVVYLKDDEKSKGNVHISIRPVGEQIGKWGGSMRMKEDGTFEFNGVPPGDYLVEIGHIGDSEEEKCKATLVSVQGGKVYEVELIEE